MLRKHTQQHWKETCHRVEQVEQNAQSSKFARSARICVDAFLPRIRIQETARRLAKKCVCIVTRHFPLKHAEKPRVSDPCILATKKGGLRTSNPLDQHKARIFFLAQIAIFFFFFPVFCVSRLWAQWAWTLLMSKIYFPLPDRFVSPWVSESFVLRRIVSLSSSQKRYSGRPMYNQLQQKRLKSVCRKLDESSSSMGSSGTADQTHLCPGPCGKLLRRCSCGRWMCGCDTQGAGQFNFKVFFC